MIMFMQAGPKGSFKCYVMLWGWGSAVRVRVGFRVRFRLTVMVSLRVIKLARNLGSIKF